MTKRANKKSETKNANVKQFEVGKIYGMNSACDSECWWYYRVESRTEKTVILRQIHSDGTPSEEIKKFRFNANDMEFFKAEACRPLGTYSMCPILTAEKECKPMTRIERQEAEEKEPVQATIDFDAAEEDKAVTIPLSDHGTLVIGGVPVLEYSHHDISEEVEPYPTVETTEEPTEEETIGEIVEPQGEATEEEAEKEQDEREYKTINALPDRTDHPSRDLSDMTKAAERSYGWSSFNPDRAAGFMIGSYQSELDSDLAEIPEENHEDYIARFRAKVGDIIAKNGRVASWAVTGPAKFNNRRNEKANNAYHNAVTNFEEWRKKVVAGYKRRAEAAKPAEQKMAEQWEAVKREIMETAASLKAIDEQHAPYTRSLFVSGLWGKMERIANKGNVELIQKATELITELNEKMTKPIFTKRHLFWTLMDKAQERRGKIEETANSESATLSFEGYDIVRNFAEDRLQIIFADVPDSDMRSNLKHNGFRWSPRNKAWQRQLTRNAEWACAQVFGKQRSEIFN